MAFVIWPNRKILLTIVFFGRTEKSKDETDFIYTDRSCLIKKFVMTFAFIAYTFFVDIIVFVTYGDQEFVTIR